MTHIKADNLISRRQFVQALAALSAAFPLVSTAFSRPDESQLESAYEKLQEPWLTLADVQQHLFPADETSPGASDINAIVFLQNMLEAPDTDAEEKEFIIKGVSWLKDLSLKNHKLNFSQLNSQQKEIILRKIEQSNAGSRWLSIMMSYLIEALLSDPVYGGNKNQLGWKWLEHIPGFPTPDSEKVYFKLGAHASPRRRTKA